MTSLHKSTETAREEAANVLLAQLLRAQGIKARAEIRSVQGTPDVRVELGSGDLVILEGKWQASSGLLEDQLNDRLEDFSEALGIIGLLYPNRLRHEDDIFGHLESASDLQWWLHGSRGEVRPERPIRTGSVADLVDHLRALPLDIEGVDLVDAAARAVGYGVEQAAQRIGSHARISRRVSDLIAESDREKDRAAALRIGCLVLFNALAFQDRLAEVNEDVQTAPEAWGYGLTGLRDAWRHICENIDYIPVFELAVNILDVLSTGRPEVQEPVIAPLLKAVNDTRHLEGHDLSGRLFHTLLTDAKFTGAYYTSVPAATMLARLVFHDWPPHVDWKDHEFPASLNVADLACGTGTLLMAVAAEAERRHKRAGGKQAAELHKAMVEQALHGYDVQLSAVHFAATSLAMLNANIQFDRMNLYVMSLGSQGSNVSLGSLDFLDYDEVAVQYALPSEHMGASAVGIQDAKQVTGSGGRGALEGVTVKLPDLDLAIMNPPFTRSNLMFGSLPTAERRKIQKELTFRLKSRQASATAGMGAAFVATAARKIRPGEGRLALVLPLTVCTGRSWEQTRALIERDFVLDMVIVSHDPTRWNFSDSTDLSEALLIATRRPLNGPTTEHRTTFVNLWQNPDGIVDAHRIADSAATTTPANIEKTGAALLEVDGRDLGEVVSISESKLTGRKWYGVQFSRADVTRSALRLLDIGEVWVPGEGETANIPLCRLDELGQIGPDRRRLIDGFNRTSSITAYPMIEGHDTEQRKSLVPSQLNYEKDIVGAVCHEHPGWKSASRWRHEPYCVPLRAHGHVASGQSHPGHAVADNYG